MTRRHAARSQTSARNWCNLPPSGGADAAGVPSPAAARERLERALARRQRLLAATDCDVCRLFHGTADGIPGLVIEKFGDVLIAQLHEGRLRLAEHTVRRLCAEVRERLGARAVYHKYFVRDRSRGEQTVGALHRDPTPWIGEPVPPEFPVLENGIRFLVRPYDGYSVGLFLEHRENRQRIRTLARGRRVLNAFAYTCGFSVAAALGGARETVNVDVSKKYLEWGRRNFLVNQLPLNDHLFLCDDIFDYYRRAQQRGWRFDLVILDPPSFARTKRPRRTFVLTEALTKLVAGALRLLNADGYLLLATNQRGISRRRLEAAVTESAGRRGFEICARPRLPADFAGDPGYARALLVQVD